MPVLACGPGAGCPVQAQTSMHSPDQPASVSAGVRRPVRGQELAHPARVRRRSSPLRCAIICCAACYPRCSADSAASPYVIRGLSDYLPWVPPLRSQMERAQGAPWRCGSSRWTRRLRKSGRARSKSGTLCRAFMRASQAAPPCCYCCYCCCCLKSINVRSDAPPCAIRCTPRARI